MKVDFYKVEMPENAGKFEDLVKAASRLPDTEDRVVSSKEWTVRLQKAELRSKVWEVEMVRIRMDELPIIASLKGEVDPIDLDDDEGIGEETAFLYDAVKNVLALQRNRFGVSGSLLCRYFEKIGELESMIDLVPYMEQDVMERIASLERVRSYSIRFASVANPSLLVKSDSMDDEEAIEVLKNALVPNLEITMSMGHQSGTLSLKSITSSIKEYLFGTPQKQAERITVEGVTHDGQKTKMDLMNLVMSDDVSVPLDKFRRLPLEERIKAMRLSLKSCAGSLVK